VTNGMGPSAPGERSQWRDGMKRTDVSGVDHVTVLAVRRLRMGRTMFGMLFVIDISVMLRECLRFLSGWYGKTFQKTVSNRV